MCLFDNANWFLNSVVMASLGSTGLSELLNGSVEV